jgi:zinc and cadmium transporter
MLPLILLLVLASTVLGLSGGLLLLWNKKIANRISFYFVGFSAGALLGVSFLNILPEALNISATPDIFLYTLIGMLTFYVIEKFMIWHHHHTYGSPEVHRAGYMVGVGDSIHNFIDGITIAVTTVVSIPLGIATTLSVFFHEIPQEISDFGIMFHAGIKRSKIILYNLVSALASVVGAIIAFYYLSSVQSYILIGLGFSAGALIYIAATDLLPAIHKAGTRKSIIQTVLLVFGILVIWLVKLASG